MDENGICETEILEPEQKTGGGKKVLKICAAALLLAAALAFAILGVRGLTAGGDTPEEPSPFDAGVPSPDRQYLEFNLLTDAVATFTLGENHSFYLALYADEGGIAPYLICLSQQDFEKYQDIYDFTFDDRELTEAPGLATVYGYSEEISDELRDYTIEYFNYFLDTDLLNIGNFEDYIGSYYLDTTAVPAKDNGDAIGMLVAAAVLLVFAVLILTVKKRDPGVHPAPTQAGDTVPVADAAEAVPAPAWEIQPRANPALALLGALVGSLAGAAVWIVLYRLGYIAGIAGYLAVFCAVWGYQKLGGGRPGKLGVVLCVAVAMAVLVLSNGVAYAWSMADWINATNPGRSSVGYILTNFSSIMTTLDMWGDFWGDLVIGLILALAAGISPLVSAFKSRKKQPIQD